MRKNLNLSYSLTALLCLAATALAAPGLVSTALAAPAQSALTAAPTVTAAPSIAAMPPMLDLVTKIGIIAGVIAAVLQGLKKFIPALGGGYAIAVNLVLSLALSYAAAPSTDPLFFVSAIGTALAAAGIHSFLRPAAPAAPATAPASISATPGVATPAPSLPSDQTN